MAIQGHMGATSQQGWRSSLGPTQEVPHRRRAPRSSSRGLSQVLQGQPRGNHRASKEGLQEKAGGHQGGAGGDFGGTVKNPRAVTRGKGAGLARGQLKDALTKRRFGDAFTSSHSIRHFASLLRGLGGYLGITPSALIWVCGWLERAQGLPDPVPYHRPCGDHHSDSGHNAERNGEDRDPEERRGVAPASNAFSLRRPGVASLRRTRACSYAGPAARRWPNGPQACRST